MVELLEEWKRGGIARAGRLTPQRSRQWASAGPKGRKRASRAAIDGENGVIPCANPASPPSSLMLLPSSSIARDAPWRPACAQRSGHAEETEMSDSPLKIEKRLRTAIEAAYKVPLRPGEKA